MEELSELCSAIGSAGCTLLHLLIWRFAVVRGSSAAKMAAPTLLRDAIVNNTSLRRLYLCTSGQFPPDECLIPALTRTCTTSSTLSAPGITHLILLLESPHTLDDVSGILTGLAHNTISLTHFGVGDYRPGRSPAGSQRSIQLLATMLRTNTSVESLKLHTSALAGELVQMLFASLEKNAHLTRLSIAGHGPDWPTASSVLDSLRVNGTLRELDLEDSPLRGKSKAAIQAQLARNQERLEQLPALKAEGSILVPPTTVRLFLCGLPHSGKTTLSASLVRWKTSSANCLPCARKSTSARMPGRTRGIRVSTMEKDGVKVALWDMAGQPEFYAFHDQMFPDLSNDATPSLFLFVWNPIQLHKSTGKEIKDSESGEYIPKTLDMFEHEFRYWLRFIASKTLKSLKFKPRLFVAITRIDLLHIHTARTWIMNSFSKCQNDFQKHIQFDMEGVFEMNATDPREATDLALYIFDCAALLLKSKPLVYQACNQARRVVADLVLSKHFAPLITKGDFFGLCAKRLGLDSIEMQEAVALSLHESGDLIYFKALELVVLDTHWFCHHFMGDLLYYGCNSRYQSNGFFSPQFLEGLLQSKVNSTTMVHGSQLKKTNSTKLAKAKRSPTIKGEDLVKLLIGLQLACRRDDDQVNSDIFIPASLCTTPRKQVHPSQYLNNAEGETFVGRRLKCKDSVCTFFTPGIFSVLQVAFNMKEADVILHEDVIAFFRDGVKVLVEFCKHEGLDHFIDVLIRSRQDSDNTIEWMNEEILDEMEKICAKPRGIQGVQLVYEVIRPRSVQEYDCMEARLGAAVLVEELSGKLSCHLEKRGFQPDCLGSVYHDWQETNDSDRVIDLLGNKETLKIIKEYRQKFFSDVEDTFGIHAETLEACSTREPEKRVFSSSVSGTERGWLFDEIRGARKDIQEVRNQIQKLGDEVLKVGQVIMPKVLQRIEELLTFAKDGEVGRIPRLFVVTRNDTGLVRIVAAMVPGLQNVRLQLLCEYRSRPHLVDEQRGISFATLEDGLLRKGLPHINMFLKLASLAVKAGAHVTTGLGHTIPDFTLLLALVVDTCGFPNLSTCLDLKPPLAPGTSRINIQEGQQWLFDVLSKYDCTSSTRIHEVFGLSRVRTYRDSHVGWLCDKHRSLGELCPI